MDKAFVTGWPIAHSRSPIIHNYWLRKYGLKGHYEIRTTDEAAFPDFLKTFQTEDYIGGNVTLPHKEMAFNLVDEKDEAAQAIGAVNTVWYEDGKVLGLNSDAYGFLASIDGQAKRWDDQENRQRGALVLGAGGASRAIIFGLLQRGFSNVWIANRTVSRAEHLALEFGKRCHAVPLDMIDSPIPNTSIIVNCTSIGMGDGQSPIDLSRFSKNTVVSDIVYAPLITPLLAQAHELGMRPVDGLGMLLHQAVLGFEKWFGIRPEVTQELRDLVVADLGEHA